ncbi:curli production assembly/transport component CsgG [Limimonas halophila]|uniref:Curli production assembly/transport component CsgG n=1 Tax=Limimonas halophila TaxID=1082479 RepID=A0A1G7S5G6_9PROT|nr:CsgG/HfaB family protein [Limimonas halophila]SDG17420.1 curli production assembly/transport component CsgG [Limimonas halophila]
MWRLARTAGLLAVAGALVSCTTGNVESIGQKPEIMPELATTKRLKQLPPPNQKMTVAVYDFSDQTGQRKPDENVAALSTAVTQGGAAILVDAAFQAGRGDWFKVLERKGLQDLLQERKIIRSTRQQFGNGQPLNPLTFGGILLEGGIISYDTNRLTGGLGARLLGIGGNTEYRADVVSVYLRAVSVKTGEIVQSVKVSKTLYSLQLQANVFKFVGVEEILEMDAGVTSNEPTQVAVRQAIESAMYALIVEGAQDALWAFADSQAGQKVIDTYREITEREPAKTVKGDAAEQTSSAPRSPRAASPS